MFDSNHISVDTLLYLSSIRGTYTEFCSSLRNINFDIGTSAKKVLDCIESRKKGNSKINSLLDKYVYKSGFNHYHLLELLSYNNFSYQLAISSFIEYFNSNEDKSELILANIQKIKSLGFEYVYFNFKKDLSKELFEYPKFCHGPRYFLDNMEVVVTYPTSKKKLYKTSNSGFCIQVFAPLQCINPEMFISSLTFNPESLPDKITKETTIDVIDNMFEEKQEKLVNLQNALDYTSYVALLNGINRIVSNMVKNTESLKNDPNLGNVVKNLSEQIELLNESNSTYLDNTADEFGFTSKEEQDELVKKVVEETKTKLKQIVYSDKK